MGSGPAFPPPFIVERVQSLGYGTGPWRRDQLVEEWGAPMADKFVAEAKTVGWLVSPSRGLYYVPAAQDLMIVSWLPEPIRSEFLVSRTLASAEIPAWCLSAWCRDRGLELGAPVFVTDLGVRRDPVEASDADTQNRRALRAAAKAVAQRKRTLPFLDSLLLVPSMPPLGEEPMVRWALAPEDADATSRREGMRLFTQAAATVVGLATWALTKEPPALGEALSEFDDLERRARGFPYSVGPPVLDEAWIIALVVALGTPRLEELVGRIQRQGNLPEPSAVQRWASLLGPPQPVAGWQEAMRDGPFPYLLVPPSLWEEMGADQAARRFRMLERIAGGQA